ncbi:MULTISPECIES: class I SAM-dependent methyltransferase [Shewanella]|uniref:SAM-dependent methyltransferase n=1 Tax=Shewanella marisflavi TaxID=260364 RepID=A0AAC9TYZ5_9GAMM|nr:MULTISPECIES: methyltransferase domain-containing protein [Shewanella]ASJ96059.1 SAM-dependent methyltransferase [Shewanella marisflavi]MCL1043209.1 methyltransferase [Shewanella marisflavi]QDF74588.1 SAM-dependent methyltransferase [Shewanella marisflavi]
MSAPRVRYQTLEYPHTDIHIRSLRDRQEYSDPLGEAESLGISSAQWSLFGVLWDSGKALADQMVSFDIDNKRILEVGCGMALASLLLNSRQADITATDYHPEAGNFLRENVRLNQGETIPFLRTSWDSHSDGLGQFDLIIGADLLYEREHIELLSTFIHRHAAPACEVILVDPGRGNHAAFSKKMCSLGYSHHQEKIAPTAEMSPSFKGQMLYYQQG